MSAADRAVVVEDGAKRPRLRRPADLLRAFTGLTLAAAVVILAFFSVEAVNRLDATLNGLGDAMPQFIIIGLGIISGIGILGIPIVASVDLLIRRRGRLLIDALVGLFLTVVVLLLFLAVVATIANPTLIDALTSTKTPAAPVDPTLGGLVAFITISRLASRRKWALASVAVASSSVVTILLTGTTSSAGLAFTLLMGWSVGLLTRWAFGTPTTRPQGTEVAAALARAGVPISALRAEPGVVGGRAYEGLSEGEPVDIIVLDRDLDGSGVLPNIWRSLRVRDDASLGGRFSMRQTLERAALMGFAARSFEVPSPQLLAVTDVGPDSAALVYERVPGEHAEPRESVNDSLIEPLPRQRLLAAWESLARLQSARLAHGDLSLANLLFGPDGIAYIESMDSGNVAASDLLLRIDVATMLCSLSLASDPESAVQTGVEVLGTEGILRALPVLQKVALPGDVRAQLRHRKDILPTLRTTIANLGSAEETEQIQIERIRPRTAMLLVLGSIAAYVLVAQLGDMDLAGLVKDANPQWVAAALLFSASTYVGAAMSLQGFTAEPISGIRTFLTQLAASFTTLVAPPTVGTVAINVRYLQKAGLRPALAAATVAVSQVVAFILHIMLLVLTGVLAGTSENFSFNPPKSAIIGFVLLAAGIGVLASQPRFRTWAGRRIGPTLSQVGPRLAAVAQQPSKLLVGIGGILLLNTSYCLALICSVRAFSPELSPAAIAFVYLAGSTIGSAAPTPGGLGAVEAALAAGLTAAGLPATLAVPAVLLFRLCTFWIPTIPGWFSFRWLTNKEAI